MTPEAFRAWRKHVRLTQDQAGAAIGKTRQSVYRYERDGVPEAEARTVALAMRAVANALPPWPSE
jgi:DNA-binding XRE family transcriptional regulator